MSGRLSGPERMLLALENRLVSPSERLARTRTVLSELELRMGHAIGGHLDTNRQVLDELALKMRHAAERRALEYRRRLETLGGALSALSPLKVLGRGYTLVQDPATGGLVKSVQDADSGREVALVFHDGKARARIL